MSVNFHAEPTARDVKTKKSNVSKLNGVYLSYVQLQEGKVDDRKPTDGVHKFFSVAVVLSEDDAEVFDDKMEDVKGTIHTKAVKTSDFEEKFKFPAPFPEQRKQYVLNLKTPSQGVNKSTKEVFDIPDYYDARPKLYVRNEDGKLVEKTMALKVGNGSKGAVSFTGYVNQFGANFSLKNVLVEELIEFDDSGYENSTETEFGETDGSKSFEDKPKQEPKTEAPKQEESKQVPTVPEPDLDFDDDIPF